MLISETWTKIWFLTSCSMKKWHQNGPLGWFTASQWDKGVLKTLWRMSEQIKTERNPVMSFRSNYTLRRVVVASWILNRHTAAWTFSLIKHPVLDLKFRASFEGFIVRSDRSHPPSHGQNVSRTQAGPWLSLENTSPRLLSELEQFLLSLSAVSLTWTRSSLSPPPAAF